MNAASQEGDKAAGSGASWLSLRGEKGIICSLLALTPTAVMLSLSKSFYTAPQGSALGWTDICCCFLLHSVLFGDVLLIASFFDLASLCPLPTLLPLAYL